MRIKYHNPWYPGEIPRDAIWSMKNLPNAMRGILNNLLAIKEKCEAEGNTGESIRIDEQIARLFRTETGHGFS